MIYSLHGKYACDDFSLIHMNQSKTSVSFTTHLKLLLLLFYHLVVE